MQNAPGYREAATPDDRWQLVWSRGAAWVLFDVMGMLMMLPFGAVLLAGATVPLVLGVPFAEIARRWGDGRHLAAVGSALGLVVAEAFGLWLAWVLLKSGGGMGLDLLVTRRIAEGTVSDLRTIPTGKGGVMYCATVAGEALQPSGAAYEQLCKTGTARVQFGRFERAVYRIWVNMGDRAR